MISHFDLDRLRRQVHEKMAAKGVTQEMLSRQTGIPKSTLSMQLRPKPYPTATVDVVAALLAWLGKVNVKEYLRDPVRSKPRSVPTVNWMVLRVLLQEKQNKLGFHNGQAAEDAKIHRASYTAFLNGNVPTLTPDTLFPLLAWLEIYDWREICDE